MVLIPGLAHQRSAIYNDAVLTVLGLPPRGQVPALYNLYLVSRRVAAQVHLSPRNGVSRAYLNLLLGEEVQQYIPVDILPLEDLLWVSVDALCLVY